MTRATPDDIDKTITLCMLDHNAVLASQIRDNPSLRNHVVIPDEHILQLQREIARLNPTPQQLLHMYDRFVRNNNYNDFALFRFIDGTIPLFTESEMESFIDKKIMELLDQAKVAVLDQYRREWRLAATKEYLYLRELNTELETRFYMRLEERKQKERATLQYRLAAVRRWLTIIDIDIRREAFVLAGQPAPSEKELALSWTYAEILFDAVEQLMRRLPCHTDTCTNGTAQPAATPS